MPNRPFARVTRPCHQTTRLLAFRCSLKQNKTGPKACRFFHFPTSSSFPVSLRHYVRLSMSSDLDLDASSDPESELARSMDATAVTDVQHEEEMKTKETAAALALHSSEGAPGDEFEDRDEGDGCGEIPEATLWRPPPQSPSKITNDDDDESSDLLLDTDVQVDVLEGDSAFVFNQSSDIKVCVPKEAHDLKALAINKIKMTDRVKQQPNFCSVDVIGPDGVMKRFAPGTKAAFAVERFNCQLKDPALPVVCIVACKDGEDSIEFGPDVELVSFDNSWTLKTLREGTGESTNIEHFESNKSTWKKVGDMDPLLYFGVKNWEDLYPSGKLPERGPPDCSLFYIGKVTLMFIFMFAFAGGLSYMPDSTQPFY